MRFFSTSKCNPVQAHTKAGSAALFYSISVGQEKSS